MAYLTTAGAAAAAAELANAIKASGAIVRVDNENFREIVLKNKEALVISSKGGFFSTNYQYLCSYKGFVFHTKSKNPLSIPQHAEIIQAGKVWLPS
ncbi:MAG: hypothetical protein EA409_07905 [Saprospirales bacterium]|nr:MAG: hypothetical protein EA409_07905 [Saprospirales bacterium]